MSSADVLYQSAGDESFDHLVYIRLFEGCNLHCEHCFIPANPKKMSLAQFDAVGGIVSGFARPGQRILFQWHGGEPTALGSKHFLEALSRVNDGCSDFDVSHGIQTNLINYDREWGEIFSEHFPGGVGVSWDPGIRLMRRGDTASNAQYETLFWANLDRLIADGISPYLIATSTRIFFDRFKNPFDFFRLMEARGVKKGHIERLTRTGYARDSWDKIGLSNAEYSRHMTRFASAYRLYQAEERRSEQPFALSPFDGLFSAVERLHKGQTGGYGCLSGACDSKFHTIDANGYKFGCTALTSEYDNSRFSGVPIQVVNLVEARTVRQADCKGCRYKPICSSGCMASDKMDSSGECSGGQRLFKAIDRFLAQPR